MPRFIEQVRAIPKEVESLPPSIKAVSFLVFIYYLGWGVVNPFMPLFFHDVLGSYTGATLIGAILFIFGVLWRFPLGEMLNTVSQKKIIRIALFFYIPLWPFLAVAQTFWHFVIYQFYHSITATGFWSATETYTRSNSPLGKRSESWGLFDVGSVFSVILGAVIGAVFLERFLDIRALFVTLPVIFAIAAFFYSKRLPEDDSHQGFRDRAREVEWKKVYTNGAKEFLSIPELRRLSPFIFFIGFLTFSLSYMLPLFSDAIGASYMHIGLIMAFFAVPLLLEVPFSVLADIWSSKSLIFLGFLIAAAVLAGIPFVSNILFLFPLAFLLGSARAMAAPAISGIASDAMPKNKIGRLNAVYSVIYSLGGILGLLVLGPVADLAGIHTSFLIVAGAMIVCAIIAWIIRE